MYVFAVNNKNNYFNLLLNKTIVDISISFVEIIKSSSLLVFLLLSKLKAKEIIF